MMVLLEASESLLFYVSDLVYVAFEYDLSTMTRREINRRLKEIHNNYRAHTYPMFHNPIIKIHCRAVDLKSEKEIGCM